MLHGLLLVAGNPEVYVLCAARHQAAVQLQMLPSRTRSSVMSAATKDGFISFMSRHRGPRHNAASPAAGVHVHVAAMHPREASVEGGGSGSQWQATGLLEGVCVASITVSGGGVTQPSAPRYAITHTTSQ